MAHAAARRLSYDKNLLREAEAAMQEQFQLRPNRSGFASSSQTSSAPPPTSVRFSEKAMPSDSWLHFWRTTRGKVLVAVLVIVIVGAIAGAVVGTTVHKSQSSQNPTPSSTTTDSLSNPLGGLTTMTAVGSGNPISDPTALPG